MSKYFTFFPKVTHTNKVAQNITRRAKVTETLLGDPYVYLPYVVKEGERPEDVAYYYYGTMDKVWMVYLANQIIDPYTDWPMNYDNFNNYIIAKYADQANATGYDVIAWTQDNTANNNIVHYKNVEDPTIKISPDTWTYDTSLIGAEWEAVRYYDYEVELNENKRNIWLINEAYAATFESELRRILIE